MRKGSLTALNTVTVEWQATKRKKFRRVYSEFSTALQDAKPIILLEFVREEVVKFFLR